MRPRRARLWRTRSSSIPRSSRSAQHLDELGDDAVRAQPRPLYEQGASTTPATLMQLAPAPGLHSFHLRTDQRQIIQQVFKAYGIDATLDDSVAIRRRFGSTWTMSSFEDGDARSGSGDAHRFTCRWMRTTCWWLHDTRDNRERFTRQEMETVYLSGLSAGGNDRGEQPGQERV